MGSLIIEGVITTTNRQGTVNVAPMGPRLLDPDFDRLELRPFKSSNTYRNLLEVPEGVFHVVDDVELIARSVVGDISPPMRPAGSVRGMVLEGACRYYELRVEEIDDRRERTSIRARTVARGRLRDFLGFNRARHAVVEAAILVSRIGILPFDEITRELERLAVLVEKTGGEVERRAFAFLESHVASASGEGAISRVVVRAGSRLHFGLLAPTAETTRRHGGVGAMVEEPSISVAVSRDDGRGPGEVSVECEDDSLRERVARVASRCLDGVEAPAVGIEVTSSARLHAGLGAGTQAALATARALRRLLGLGDAPICELARVAGRGRRSGVGIHGFELGGLIVDGGHGISGDGDGAPPLVARAALPDDWRVVLAAPRGERGLSGAAEREAFEALRGDGGDARTAELCRLALLEIVPAATGRDFRAFSAALGEYGRRAGEFFAPIQGGVFASRAIESIIDLLGREGIEGAGQSSWGPTVFAFTEDLDRAMSIAAMLRERLGDGALDAVVTAPRNRGASVE